MPIQFGVIRSAAGHEILRTESTGEVSLEHALEYRRRIFEEGEGKPHLGVIRKGVEWSPEARREFSSLSAAKASTALAYVVESAPLRVTLSFMLRVARYDGKVFSSEAAAMEFLEAELAVIDARQRAPKG